MKLIANPNEPLLNLENLSTEELKSLKSQVELVLVPVGSVEQHGPNMSLGTDTALAEASARLVALRLYPQVLLAPSIRWGISNHHMDFCGTITLRMNTFISLVIDIIRSLCQHGFTRFLFINGHSGNRSALEAALIQAFDETDAEFLGSCQYFDLAEETGAGHAAYREVSYGLYLDPQTVKQNALQDGEIIGELPFARSKVFVPWTTKRTSRNGPSGPLGSPSAEVGRQMLSTSLENLVQIAQLIVNQKISMR